MPTIKHVCEKQCQSEYQDQRYKGKRLLNACLDGIGKPTGKYRCTICGHVSEIKEPSS